MKNFTFISVTTSIIIFLVGFVGEGGFWPSLLISTSFCGMLFYLIFWTPESPSLAMNRPFLLFRPSFPNSERTFFLAT